ncbi:hypothetical protein AB0K14_11575 [Actinosynnema sp. NPDC050801]|uniref:hypothetical protein n=1 Tax=unclassified Actinosynnema TaxID=2637065 RepID=UPI0033DFCB91
MEPQGELRTPQSETTRIARLLNELVLDALRGPQPDATTGLLKAVAGQAQSVATLVAVKDYSVGESLYVGLTELATSLGAVCAALTGDRGFQAAAAEVDELRLWVLDEIQRPTKPRHGTPSVGFEWQTDIKVDMKGPPLPSKTLLKRWPKARKEPEILRLELDGDELEFVTSPVTTLAALELQIAAIAEEVAFLASCGYAGHDYPLPEAARSDETGDVAFEAGYLVHVRHYGGSTRGPLQATTARALTGITDLLSTYGGKTAATAIEQIDDFYADAPPVPRVAALLHLVRYYVLCLTFGTTDDQGPKVLLPVMSRTDFHSAYLLLDAAERRDFERCVFYGQQATGQLAWLGDVLAQKGYKGPAGAVYVGPTIGEWYHSIVDGTPSSPVLEPLDRDNDGAGPRGRYRDLLSPPKGYPAHRQGRHFTYAMGFFGTAEDGSMLFELRQVERVAARSEPVNKKYSTATVFDAMRTFAAGELPAAPAPAPAPGPAPATAPTDDPNPRPTKRSRVETKGSDAPDTGQTD